MTDPMSPAIASSPYRTLFLCTLEQRTALSVGGRDDDADASLHDMPLALEGAGRPVLNGRTLAGALVATARTMLDVPQDISLIDGAPDDIARPGSLWEVWNAHLIDAQGRFLAGAGGPATDSRAGVALRQDTRAAASHLLFDTELLPAGVRWGLLIEVRHPPPTDATASGRRASAMLALVLREWQRERCWIGRRVARGLGWMALCDCKVVELPRTEAAVDAWPRASLPDLNALWEHASSLATASHPAQRLDDFIAAHAAEAGALQQRRAYVRWPLRLSTGIYSPDVDTATATSYGLDVISVGGHAGAAVSADELAGHIVRAEEQRLQCFEEGFAPDFVVAMQPGKVEPAIPGSAIVGAWRHFMSRLARAAGHRVLDPATGAGNAGGPQAANAQNDDAITGLFGFVLGDEAASSALLLSDAAMDAGHDWKVALLEKVALDEFTQGAFEGAKFNRMAVLDGAWSFTLVQEVDLVANGMARDEIQARIEQATAPVRELLAAAGLRQVAVGGGEFRAYGHLPVTIRTDPGCQWALAGESWQKWPELPHPLQEEA